MKKGIRVVIVVILIIFIIKVISINEFNMFYLFGIKDECMSKSEIIEYVTENQEKIETAAYEFINDNPNVNGHITGMIDIPACDKIVGINLYNGRFNFECGGYGMGSETGYAGFYYLSSGEKIEIDKETNTADMTLLGYFISRYEDMKFYPENDGWRWKEENGDNTVYIENIVGNFYYYLEEY
ncbi:MAG: hypothetical protein ACI4VF_10365 [Lachnospirales bacterium]